MQQKIKGGARLFLISNQGRFLTSHLLTSNTERFRKVRRVRVERVFPATLTSRRVQLFVVFSVVVWDPRLPAVVGNNFPSATAGPALHRREAEEEWCHRVAECRNLKVTPHVAQNRNGRVVVRLMLARRTTPDMPSVREKGNALKSVSDGLKTIALLRKVRHRGIFKVSYKQPRQR